MERRSFDVELTRADYAVGLSALMAELARGDKARPRLLFARLATLTVVTVVVLFAFPSSATALLSAILLFWLGDTAVQAAFQTQVTGVSFVPEAHARAKVEFSDDGIVEQGAFRTRRWNWDALKRIHLRPNHVVVELVGWDMIVLPDRLWSGADDRNGFVAELTRRQSAGAPPSPALSPREAETQVLLIEPVLIARIALTVAALQLIFEWQRPRSPDPDQGAILLVLAAALLGGVVAWAASGRAFRWLAARSPTTAMAMAWGVSALLIGLFALWFFGLI